MRFGMEMSAYRLLCVWNVTDSFFCDDKFSKFIWQLWWEPNFETSYFDRGVWYAGAGQIGYFLAELTDFELCCHEITPRKSQTWHAFISHSLAHCSRYLRTWKRANDIRIFQMRVLIENVRKWHIIHTWLTQTTAHSCWSASDCSAKAIFRMLSAREIASISSRKTPATESITINPTERCTINRFNRLQMQFKRFS